MKRQRLEFCGAFNGTCILRRGETAEQALERIEEAIQRAIDARKSLDVNVGVDHGDFTVEKVA